MKIEIDTNEIDDINHSNGDMKINVTCENGHKFAFYAERPLSIIKTVESAIEENAELIKLSMDWKESSRGFLFKSRAALAELYIIITKQN